MSDEVRELIERATDDVRLPEGFLGRVEKRKRRREARSKLVVIVVPLAVFAVASIPLLRGFGLLGPKTGPSQTLGATAGSPPPDVISKLQAAAERLAGPNMSATATPPTSAEVVGSTYAQAEKVAMSGDYSTGAPQDASVWVVQMLGDFTGYDATSPLGSQLPTGTAFMFIFDPSSGNVTDWGMGPPVDLAKLGTVFQMPVDITPTGGVMHHMGARAAPVVQVTLSAPTTTKDGGIVVKPGVGTPAITAAEALAAAKRAGGEGGFHPARILLAYVSWHGNPEWLVSFQGGNVCQISDGGGINPSPAVGASPMMCIGNAETSRIDATSGRWIETFSGGGPTFAPSAAASVPLPSIEQLIQSY